MVGRIVLLFIQDAKFWCRCSGGVSSDVDVTNPQVYQVQSIFYSDCPSLFPSLGLSMKVISTDAGASLPAKDGQAEILNSSLVKYSMVTVCARFLTHHFSTDPNSGPAQILLYYADHVLLSSYTTRSCDQYFQVLFNSI